MSGPSDAIRPNAPPATDERMVGRQFLAALRARDFSTITALFADESEFRALVLPAYARVGDRAKRQAGFGAWFGEADQFEVVDARTDLLMDCLYLGYRLRVHDAEGWRLIEQHAYCTIHNQRIDTMRLVCSGFRPE